MRKALLLAVAGITAISFGAGAQAQQLEFHTYQTTNGCLIRDVARTGGWPPQPEDVWTWSGPCAAGQYISGNGVLLRDFIYEDRMAETWTGALADGFRNGEGVEAIIFEYKSRREGKTENSATYTMGCKVVSGNLAPNCTPGSASATAPPPPRPRIPTQTNVTPPAAPAPSSPRPQSAPPSTLTPAQIAECDRVIKTEQVASQSWPGDVRAVSARLGRFQFDLFTGRCAGHPEAAQYLVGARRMLAQGGVSVPATPPQQSAQAPRTAPSTTARAPASVGANNQTGRQERLNPQTGQPCITVVDRDRRDIPYYIEHGITLANSCTGTAKIRIQYLPQAGPPREQNGVVYSNRQNRFWCLQYKDASREGARRGCMGIQSYEVTWD